jgi:hypothetical protein
MGETPSFWAYHRFEDLSFRARLILANQDSIEEKDECPTIGRIICLEVAPAIDGGLPGMPQEDGFGRL